MQKMGRFTQAATLKMPGTQPQTVRSVPPFLSEGVKEFQAICVVGGKAGVLTEYTAPCGVCRQVMMEFCNPETFQVILAVDKEHYNVYTLKELLPLGFGPSNLA